MKKQKSIEEIKADYHLFIDIQMGKYFKQSNKECFDNDDEANLILGKIVQIWNSKIADNHARLDNSDLSSKSAWFNSVEIDFSNKEFDLPEDAELTDIYDDIPLKDLKKIDALDEIFYFLPKGAFNLLIFAGPALEAYEYPFERFKELLNGEKPTEIEEDILKWAFDLVVEILNGFFYPEDLEHHFFEAVSIAEEELEQKLAVEVVSKILTAIEDEYGKSEESIMKKNTDKKNKKSQKKGKKKK
ncbi:MAG: hypothetical protein K9N07_09430 [Candidatus Cloacimonetes bacterium]|nr:hypothetical protein [Candidatus Cloacimonadota bacterium]